MNYLIDRPAEPVATLILAHGAGAPMDSDFMNQLSAEMVAAGITVVRFEFPYMALRREDGKKRPPNRQPVLLESFAQVVADVVAGEGLQRPLLIGGKSMGGRMATLLAAENTTNIDGVCCFGFPFHPPGKPEKQAQRTAHLKDLATPIHIFQGTRDPFGSRDGLNELELGAAVKLHWLEDGDHDLKPRKASGLTQNQHLKASAGLVRKLVG